MKYLCLIYTEENQLETLSEQEMREMIGEYRTYTEALRQSGHWLAAEALQPVHTATTVRVRNQRLSVTDGPFAESKEQLGGFYLIDARDLNDAIRIASHIPGARHGAVEVRPIRELSPA